MELAMIRPTLALSIVVALAAGPAAAQDFGRMARQAAERVAAAAAGRAAESVLSGGVSAPARAGAQPATAAPVPAPPPPQTVAPASDFAAPAPINYRPGMASPHDLEFSAEDAEGRQRLTTFSRYSCNDCEGGYAFGAWVGHYVSSLWGDHVLARRLGGMAVGQHLDWQVPAMRGAGRIDVVGAQPIGPWACKQVRWTATRPEGSASRMGLVCQVPRRNAEPRWEDIL